MTASGETYVTIGAWAVMGVLFCAAATAGGANAPRVRLVPKPAEMKVSDGAARAFQISPETVILHDKATAELAEMLAKDIAAQTHLDLKTVTAMATASKVIEIRSASGTRPLPKGDEAYELVVGPSSVRIRASRPAGRFYGTRTLLQLLLPGETLEAKAKPTADAKPAAKIPPASIPAMRITDAPRFAWRGLMLDCSRTFQSVDYVRKTIDRMALYKMNVLHMHLTDDQGWRLEIRRYPELTKKGAEFPAKYNEPARHQGYYTQTQMKALIAYAAARHITIVPEIEMPGHCLAALACYPRLGCTGGPFEIHPFFKGPGVHKEIYCAGNEETFEFLKNVLSEVIELFPSQYIHIGGDEAKKDCWNKCPKCQARIKAEGLKDAHELQSWFIKRIDKFVTSKGKRIIGWDEILQGGLADNAAVMSWRGVKGGQAAAKAGHDVVMSPTSHCYFDYNWKRIDTRRAFSFDPTAGMTDAQARFVLGLQANFWSHIDREEPLVDAQLFPRLLGIAERGWSPKADTDTADFATRVKAQLPRLEMLGVNYHRED